MVASTDRDMVAGEGTNGHQRAEYEYKDQGEFDYKY